MQVACAVRPTMQLRLRHEGFIHPARFGGPSEVLVQEITVQECLPHYATVFAGHAGSMSC